MRDQTFHIVHVSTVHSATDTRIFHKECRSLSNAGFEVTLIARAEAEEHQAGIRILPVKSGSGNRFVRMTRGVFEAYKIAVRENGDAYHLHDAELLPVGVLLRARGHTVVYDAHEDLVGQIKSKSWIPKLARSVIAKAAGLIEVMCARYFSLVIIANPLQGTRFNPDKTLCIQNFPLLTEAATQRTINYLDRDNYVFYVGGLAEIRGIRQMVDAIDIVNRTRSVKLLLGGWFSPTSLECEISTRPGWKHTVYLGRISRDQVVSALNKSRIGLVVVHPVPNFQSNQPVKLFEYMMAGIPIVASDIPNYRQFVSALDTGLMVDPLKPQEIADAILWLLDHPVDAMQMGERGQSAILDRYNWETEVEKLVDYYASKGSGSQRL